MKALSNIGASVHQRLKNSSERSGRTFNDLAQYYALERWLYRLSKSRHAQNFILKGALMLVAWRAPVLRATRDIDLLARMSNDLDKIKEAVAEVCRTEVEEDGVVFDADAVVTERIAEDAEYEGVRAKFRGLLATTRLAMQIDFGFSDVITPGPVDITYPTILDYPAPLLLAYNRETVVAEKFEAMASLGRLNSRMKDFFDVWLLATASDFEELICRPPSAPPSCAAARLSSKNLKYSRRSSHGTRPSRHSGLRSSNTCGRRRLLLNSPAQWLLSANFSRPFTQRQ